MRLFAFIILFANCLSTFDCANKSETFGRIIRGRDAVDGQFPYAVRMDVETKDAKYLCGAALIGAKWLLTAAHCVYDAISLQVYLGSISINRVGVMYDVPISNIIFHPKYKSSANYNDIALIRIPQTILNSNIAVVPIPKLKFFQPDYKNAYATTCGWGFTAMSGHYFKDLQYGRLQILSIVKCRSVNVLKAEICTPIGSNFPSPYRGDSGAPLVLESTGELVGILSHGTKKNSKKEFAVFTRVSSYLYWIQIVSGILY